MRPRRTSESAHKQATRAKCPVCTQAQDFAPSRKEEGQATSLLGRDAARFIRSHARKSSKLTSVDSESFEEKEIDPAFARHSTVEEEAFRSALLGTLLAALHEEVPPRTYLIFELVKLNGESPEAVAEQLGVGRNVVDNTVFKAMKKLREISKREEIQQEL